MASFPMDSSDEGWDHDVFVHWRKAPSILRQHYYLSGKTKATCLKCEVPWPCDVVLLGRVLRDTTENLVITDYMAYHRQGG